MTKLKILDLCNKLFNRCFIYLEWQLIGIITITMVLILSRLGKQTNEAKSHDDSIFVK